MGEDDGKKPVVFLSAVMGGIFLPLVHTDFGC